MALTDELMSKHEIMHWDISGSRRGSCLPGWTICALILLWANHHLYSKTTTFRNYGMTYWTSRWWRWTPDTSGLWVPLLPACHGQTPLVTRLSSGPPAHTLPFLWKTKSTLCLCSSLKKGKGQQDHEWEKETLVEVLDAFPRDIFPNLNRLLQALLRLPMKTCTVERLFQLSVR